MQSPTTEELPAAGAPDTRPATVGEAGEHRVIALVRSLVPPAPAWVSVGIGDDGAVVEAAKNRLEVLTTDVLVEGVHFDRSFCDPASIGHKALAVNLSDLAAMGAAPRLALLSLGLPPKLPFAELEALLRGLMALAAVHKVTLVGGNVARSPGPLFIDVTLTGTVKRRRVLTRSGARAGDALYVTGSLGAAAAGLLWLRQAAFPADAEPASLHHGYVKEDVRPSTGGHPAAGEPKTTHAGAADAGVLPGLHPAFAFALGAASPAVREAVERFLRPEPRMRFGIIAGRTKAASACMDLSDGLADAVRQMAQASGLGAILDASTLPIHAGAAEILTTGILPGESKDPVRAALSGGEDYELLFAVSRRSTRRFLAVQRLAGVPVTKIGVLTTAPDLVLQRDGCDAPLPSGFEHFA